MKASPPSISAVASILVLVVANKCVLLALVAFLVWAPVSPKS